MHIEKCSKIDQDTIAFEIEDHSKRHIGLLKSDTIICFSCQSVSENCTLSQQEVREALQNNEKKEKKTKNVKLRRLNLRDLLEILHNNFKIAYDRFTDRIIFENNTLEDHHITGLVAELQEKGYTTSIAIMQKAVERVAYLNQFDSLYQYFKKLKWDGVPRLAHFFPEALSTPPEKLIYSSEIGKRFLVGAVERAIMPGCHHRVVLILIGKQNIGKSLFCRDLCPKEEWFSDYLPRDLHTREANEAVFGAFIIENAELASHNKSSLEAIKAFISRPKETFRPAYARYKITYPRRCVIIGTTNDESPLIKSDENIRFWPIQVGEYNREWLLQNKEQLWAEAVHLYREGYKWWDVKEIGKIFEIEKDEATADDVIAQAIDRLDTLGQIPLTVTMREITQKLSIPDIQVTRAVETRIGLAMRELGYQKIRVRKGGMRTCIYQKEK